MGVRLMENHRLQLHHYPDADVLIRFKDDDDPITDIPPASIAPVVPPAMLTMIVVTLVFLPVLSLLLQLFLIAHPLVATISIQAWQLSRSLDRQLAPITLSQTQVAATTGSVHQDAKAAVGVLTLYNGLSTPQTIPASTLFTGSDGIEVVTDSNVIIPAANLPAVGEITVTAHAVNSGVSGNIAAGDISATFVSGVVARNLSAFTGGRNAVDYKVVAKADIDTLTNTLQTALIAGAGRHFLAQAQKGEVLLQPTCSSAVHSNRQPGQAATQVQVTVHETCKAFVVVPDHIKQLVAGKTTQAALSLLGHAAISFSGFGDDSRMPKNI